MKMTRIIFRTIAVLVLAVGLTFSFLIAEFGDAPGLLIIGPTISLAGAATVYGVGEIIVYLNKSNDLFHDIQEKIGKK